MIKLSRPNEDDINFPWFIYPGTPFRGYMDPIYLPELDRLLMIIKNIRYDTSDIYVNKATLLHLTIGSPMEEAGSITICKKNVLFQMHQLLPDHLLRTAELDIPVLNIIICPNKIINPMFMIFTDDFTKVDNTKYIHKYLPLTILIFQTLMPTDDKIRNKKYMEKFIENKLDVKCPDGIEMYRQTDADRIFVKMFYSELLSTLNHIMLKGGYNTCFSFAVFNEHTVDIRYNNFIMFKELLVCYESQKNTNTNINTMICEWIFSYGSYIVYDMTNNNLKINNKNQHLICYVPIEKLKHIKKDMLSSLLIPNLIDSHTLNFDVVNIHTYNTNINDDDEDEDEAQEFTNNKEYGDDNLEDIIIPSPTLSTLSTLSTSLSTLSTPLSILSTPLSTLSTPLSTSSTLSMITNDRNKDNYKQRFIHEIKNEICEYNNQRTYRNIEMHKIILSLLKNIMKYHENNKHHK